ncbi:MAG: TetR/AcrR family transcriptional regulator [Desulfomonilia bacterium]|jgi:TetR/AcrR family fatty acid metabolism transcriptional regulator|uniref:Fatty acid degradation regulator YsiA, TetR family n=1 Tax=anaerobic digester metagenome TaxID=1263854 RepID=A0A485LVS1_9ZZZZ|nr:TetR/AcrR family transcriptional regulator [Pseudomonadota bacterium]HON39743.1 TetR/AcrR family transcriptional regulator [Deltaproteobacteria bacterium]HRS57417.1 TetR/AcrR family transcriptional regulator [Desulfomonilia bacterium]HPD22644.1 TetR/AcrR family transcriptional regulator [Deltaproteobacteria bacterium]HPX18708.1 TetR/AcrR family transcriptional regulator [Deltaproteobacteria bacterium]
MRGEEKYRMILNAAKHVFAMEGFYNSKVSEIAREAHVADGTIYLYFKNKDDILISLFEEELNRIMINVKSKIEHIEDPREKIIVFCDNHLNMVESDRALAEVIQVELRQSNKFMREYKNKHFLAYLNIIADIVAQGQEQGIFRTDVRPDICARMIFGSLDELSTYLVTARRKRFDVHEVAIMVGNSFLNGLVKK